MPFYIIVSVTFALTLQAVMRVFYYYDQTSRGSGRY